MNVLVADDNQVFREVLERMLVSWGFSVSLACDGEQAWGCLQKDSAPQLVILDWVMPGVDGIELCRRIRASNRPSIYILMLTAKTEPADLLAAIEAGADDYVSKPLNSAELRARLTLGCRRVESLSWGNYPEETYLSAMYAEWG